MPTIVTASAATTSITAPIPESPPGRSLQARQPCARTLRLRRLRRQGEIARCACGFPAGHAAGRMPCRSVADRAIERGGEPVDLVGASSRLPSRRGSRCGPSSADMPWARSTWLGSASPAEHAEPAATAYPSRSSAEHEELGADARDPEQAVAGQPVGARRRRRRRRRAGPPRAGRASARRWSAVVRAAASAAANPTQPGMFSVPERWPRSCPPPRTSGRSRPGSRATRQPTPFGPCSLCAETAIESTPERAKLTRSDAAAWTASQWNGTPRSRGDARELLDRLHDARHVVRPHDRGDAVARAHRLGERLDVDRRRRRRPAPTPPRTPAARARAPARGRRDARSRSPTRRPSGRPQKPNTAWLSASEPPEVKTTWAGSQSR